MSDKIVRVESYTKPKVGANVRLLVKTNNDRPCLIEVRYSSSAKLITGVLLPPWESVIVLNHSYPRHLSMSVVGQEGFLVND